MPDDAFLLIVGGLALQIIGSFLLVLDALARWWPVPRGWLTRGARRLSDLARWLLRRTPRARRVSLSGEMRVTSRMEGALTVGHRDDAPIEEKVDFLLRRDQQTQQVVNRLSRELSNLPKQ